MSYLSLQYTFLYICCFPSAGHTAGAALRSRGIFDATGKRSGDQWVPQRPEAGGGVRGQGQNTVDRWETPDMRTGSVNRTKTSHSQGDGSKAHKVRVKAGGQELDQVLSLFMKHI